REARRLAPEEPEVVLKSVELALERGDLRQAGDYLRAGCAKNPKDVRLCLRLAAVEMQGGKPEQAVACLRQGLERVPGQVDLLSEFVNALIEAGQREEAAATLKRLPKDRVQPGLLDYLTARLRVGENNWLEAAGLLENAFPLLAA